MTGLKVLRHVSQCVIKSENFILFKYYNFQILLLIIKKVADSKKTEDEILVHKNVHKFP